MCCQIFWTAALTLSPRSPGFAPWQTCLIAAGPLASSMFSEVDKLVRIYLTIPVTTATGERSLSAVRCIKTYLRSTMSQQRLNSVMLLNVHKDLTDGLDLPALARQFVDANERRRHFFGTVHSPQWNPPERLGLTVGTVRLELFGNLTECVLLYYANDYCIYDCRLHDCGWYHACSN